MTFPVRSLKKEFFSNCNPLPKVDGWQKNPANKSLSQTEGFSRLEDL
jgi:hypothetical protein